MDKKLKIALPKGRLMAETAALLEGARWGMDGYHEGTRLYHLESIRFPNLFAKIFQEKDVPVQVAVGNYDLGICGLDWVEELLVKYPGSALVKVKNLGYKEGSLYMAASQYKGAAGTGADRVRIASEYPNMAAFFALKKRLRRFSIFPLWGAAEAYPPESADMVLIPAAVDTELASLGLVSVGKVLDYSAYLIANRSSWETKDMGEVLDSIGNGPVADDRQTIYTNGVSIPDIAGKYQSPATDEGIVRLALPDGHQQKHTVQLLSRAGIRINDYPSAAGSRRPDIGIEGVTVKVIRPQDMPLQVANGNFDLAITGRDWLTEHLCQFPSSPVTELLDLKFGKVKIVAVVSNGLAIDDVSGLRGVSSAREVSLRVASEYVNIADKYARENHLGMYRVIPTWGASEGFLPEDADLLIENTETGRTLARHNLKIIDTLFISTARLVGNTDSIASAGKGERIRSITGTLQRAVEDT